MGLRRKIALWSGGAAGLMLVLVTALFFLAPFYLNTPELKTRIESALSRSSGGTVKYDKLDLSFFPRPRIIIVHPRLSLPGIASAALKSVAASPQLLPLMKGKLFLSRVRLEEPDIIIHLPQAAVEKMSQPLSAEEVRAGIKPTLAFLEAVGPGFIVQIDGGRIAFAKQGRNVLVFRNVQAHFVAPPGEIELSLSALSDVWGPVALGGNVLINEEKIEGSNLTGTFGSSSFSGLSASLSFRKPHLFHVASGTASLSLDELFFWLLASGNTGPWLQDIQGLKGSVRLSAIDFGGPLETPSSWEVKIAGEGKSIVIESRLLPAPLELAGRFSVDNDRVEVQDLRAALGESSLTGVAGRYQGKRSPRIDVFSGKAVISLDQVFDWRSFVRPLDRALAGVKALSGKARISSLRFGGLLDKPETWRAEAIGSVENLIFDREPLPGPLVVTDGGFKLDQDTFTWNNAHASILDSSLILSGALQGLTKAVTEMELDVSGVIGQKSMDWTFTTFSLPPLFAVKTPLALSPVHIMWKRPSEVTIAGQATVAAGPVVTIDFSQNPKALILRKGTITNGLSKTTFAYRSEEKSLSLAFSGTLAQSTLNEIFSNATFGAGEIEGTLQAGVPVDQPQTSVLTGNLRGTDIVIPWGLAVPLRLDRLALHAQGSVLTLDRIEAAWGPSRFSLSGDVTASPDGFILDLSLNSGGFRVEDIVKALARPQAEKKPEKQHRVKRPPLPVRGVVQLNTASLGYGPYTFSPLDAVVTLNSRSVRAAISNAGVCGVSVAGTLGFGHGAVAIDLTTKGTNLPLEQSASCLFGTNVSMTGTFDISGAVSLKGRSGALIPSLEGKADFKSKDGKIYHYPVLAKIFSVLSVTELFRGKLPELGGSGFPYHTMTVKGRFHEGKFVVDQAFIDGSTLTIIAEGDVDLAAKKLDLVVLVSPFSTVNWIIRHIPLVGKIMGGTLISVPVKVSGDLANPDVTVLAPSAVGKRIIELLKNIVELPVELISPLLPKQKEEESK